MKSNLSKKSGDLLVIMITGMTAKYIAEVVEEEPLVLKVEESGPLAQLKDGDFIIMNKQSEMVQGGEEEQQNLLTEAVKNNHPLLSGLQQLGVTDGKCHEILPVETVS